MNLLTQFIQRTSLPDTHGTWVRSSGLRPEDHVYAEAS